MCASWFHPTTNKIIKANVDDDGQTTKKPIKNRTVQPIPKELAIPKKSINVYYALTRFILNIIVNKLPLVKSIVEPNRCSINFL